MAPSRGLPHTPQLYGWSLNLEIESDRITGVFTGFGERGVSAKMGTRRAANSVQGYLASGLLVDRDRADQLLIPMALTGGGKFRTLSPTQHTTTNSVIINKFLDVENAVPAKAGTR